MFTGSLVALVTPLAEGEVDLETLREMVGFQIDSGIDGIVPLGITGEAPTLTYEEYKQIIEVVVEEAAGRIPVIIGTGSNNTAEALELTELARQLGADGALQTAPYYNKPTQEGLYHHFAALVHQVDLPIILHNIPERCGVNMEARTVIKLAEIDNIVGFCQGADQLDQVSEIADDCDLTILSGDDTLTLPMASVGGKGVVSVAANIVPTDIKALTDALLEGDFATARQWHNKLFKLCRALANLAPNPIAVKAALSILKMAPEQMRLPLTPLGAARKKQLEQILTDYGLLD